MAATVNANALSPRSSNSGEGTGSLNPRPAKKSSPPWSEVVRGAEGGVLVTPHAVNSSVSLVAAEVLAGNAVVGEKKSKGGSLTEGSESETKNEVSDNGDGGGNGSKKPVWNKPSNVAPDSGPVMGAVSWPTLSESTKAPPKPLSADSSDPPASLPRVANTTVYTSPASSSSSVAPQRQMTSSPNSPSSPNSNATQHHVRPVRQRSMKHERVGNSSNGGFSHQPPQSGSVDTNVSTTEHGASDSLRRDHGHNYAYREGGQRDHHSQRNYRRGGNSGPHLRGDGSFGGRRDQDRASPDWIHQRSFNGRGPVMPQQRGGPRGFVRPPPLGAAPYIPPPIQPYNNPVGIPPEMQPPYYFPPQPGMPFVAQVPHAAYFSPLDPQLPAKIIIQIDYYFSNGNLIKDTYLRQNMDEHGWVPIQLIARFNKVKQLTTNIQLILDSLRASTIVEIQGDKIRKRNDWIRWIMPPSVHLPTASGSQSPRMPNQDTLAAHVQGLAINENSARSSSGDVNVHGETSKVGSNSSGR